MKKILIVLSSARSQSAGDKVLVQVQKVLQEYPHVAAGTVDFRQTPLPFFDGNSSPTSPEYEPTNTNVKNWIKAVNEADNVIIISAEYNYSYTGVLKNAIDFVPPTVWKDKPVHFIGYGWGGGIKALSKLRTLLTEYLKANPSDMGAALYFTKELNPDGSPLDEDKTNELIREVLNEVKEENYV